MPGLILPLAVLIGGGIYYATMKKPSSASKAGSTTPPKFTPGPGGFGRIYGTPNVDVTVAFWASSKVMMGCDWVIEGHGFLPQPANIGERRATSLDAALNQGDSAWPFVEWLLANPHDGQMLNAQEATGVVLASVGRINDETLQQCDAAKILQVGTPAFNWATDVGSRIAAYAAARIQPSRPPRQTATTTTRAGR